MTNNDQLARLWNRTDLTNAQIATKLGVSRNTLHKRALAAGLPKRRTGRPPGSTDQIAAYQWTQKREARLTELWPSPELTIEQIAADLGTTYASAQARARKLGLPHHPQRTRAASVDGDLLTLLWCDTALPLEAIAQRLGISTSTLQRRAKGMGLIPGSERSVRSRTHESGPIPDNGNRAAYPPGTNDRTTGPGPHTG
ncbi:hypothetical protein [Streptomyces sp. NPDC060366]|uniref:hypothetical protein n=1 Tax=Streptomyces sp. NPDC060366 TaxID=3347105 RepID=UPI003656B765